MKDIEVEGLSNGEIEKCWIMVIPFMTEESATGLLEELPFKGVVYPSTGAAYDKLKAEYLCRIEDANT